MLESSWIVLEAMKVVAPLNGERALGGTSNIVMALCSNIKDDFFPP